jgi:hypothetical protein
MLRTDFHRIPEILELGPPPQPQPVELIGELEPELEEIPEPEEPPDAMAREPAAQLGLF